MNEYVELQARRHRGWPWPESSFGLAPMYGEDGWCHSCGIPLRGQVGSLVLQRRNLTVVGFWTPNWAFDVVCVDKELGIELSGRFGVTLRPVAWPAAPLGDAFQIEIPVVGDSWFSASELEKAALKEHGKLGDRCGSCGNWRWYPLGFDLVSPLDIRPVLDRVPVAASPEWFGSGRSAFRENLFRRDVAEFVVESSPRDYRIQEVVFAD